MENRFVKNGLTVDIVTFSVKSHLFDAKHYNAVFFVY